MQEIEESFKRYFSRKINGEQLANETGMNCEGFHKTLSINIQECIDSQDSNFLGLLIWGTAFWAEKYPEYGTTELPRLTSLLNELLILEWHQKHEDIVLLLQRVQSKSSVPYLYQASKLQLPYLDWDEYFSFPKKCIRAIARIGGDEAVTMLNLLAKDENEEISRLAERKLCEI